MTEMFQTFSSTSQQINSYFSHFRLKSWTFSVSCSPSWSVQGSSQFGRMLWRLCSVLPEHFGLQSFFSWLSAERQDQLITVTALEWCTFNGWQLEIECLNEFILDMLSGRNPVGFHWTFYIFTRVWFLILVTASLSWFKCDNCERLLPCVSLIVFNSEGIYSKKAQNCMLWQTQ